MTISRASLSRRAWIVPLCVVIVTVAAVIVGGNRSSYYLAQGSLVVYGPGTGAFSPANIATTDAELIPSDNGVIAAISQATGTPVSVVAGRITAIQPPDTAIIQVTYADPSMTRSLLGVNAALHAVIGSHPKASGIPPNELRLVSGPDATLKQNRRVPGGPVPIGIVLGLFLGIGVFLAWERSDPRADDERSLERELGIPVTELPADFQGTELSALQHRWSRLASDRPGATVALVDATRGSATVNRELNQTLEQLSTASGAIYLTARAPGVSDEDDLATMSADLTILVAARGEPVAEIRSNIRALRKLGVEPRWTLLAG